MKRFAWLAGACGLTLWGLSSAIAGCGGEDAASPGGDDDASTSSSTSSSSSSSSGGSSSGGSSSTSSSGGTDGGSDGGPTDGGSSSGSTPKKISCGSTTCNADTQTCCVSGPPLDAGCIATGADCNNGVTVDCDEKADCSGAGEICCGNLTGTECRTKCNKFQYQICKTDAECASDAGGGCKVYTCAGRQVQTCSKPYGCK